MTTISRRELLVAGAAAGGGLLIGCRVGGKRTEPPTVIGDATSPAGFVPNAFIRIGRDGFVTLVMQQVEMGQGTYTSMPMLLAEELEIGLDRVRLEHAPPDDRLYANPLLGFQATGGSTSIRGAYGAMRQAGAMARTMLVAAAAAQWKVDPASCKAERGAVVHAGSSRRLTYGELADMAATLTAPAVDTLVLKDPKQFTLIGTPAKRLDARGKVDGSAQFGLDVRLPGMLIAAITGSPVIGGTVATVDDSRALQVKGVRQVVRLDNAVAVVADHMHAAKQGVAALAITWNEGANATLGTADLVAQLERASRGPAVVARKVGDPARALAGAARRLEAVYQEPLLAHATMEPLNCTVQVKPDRCEIWVGSQILGRAQAVAAQVTGLPLDQVIVHNHLIGGGFGRRLEVDYVVQAVRVAQQVPVPVKVVWTREEDVRGDIFRPYYLDRVSAGLDREGKPVAWTHRVTGPSILARWAPPAFQNGLDSDAVDGAAEPPYAFAALQVEYVRQEQPFPTGWWRGVGPTKNVFVVESFFDELAHAAGQDAVAYRRALLGDNPRALAVLDLAAKEGNWGAPLPAGQGRGIALQQTFGSYMAQVVEVEVTAKRDVLVRRVVAAVDCGVVVNPDTVRAQLEGGIVFGISGALWGQVTLKNGRVEQSNFHDYRVMRMNETPKIAVHLIASREAPGGIGEPGTSLVAPALANAIFAATGRRIRTLPLEGPTLRAT